MKESIQLFKLEQFNKLEKNYDFITWWTETCIFKWILKKEDIYILKEKIWSKKLVYITSLLPWCFEKEYFIFLKDFIDIIWDNLEITINDWWIYYFLEKNWYLKHININIWHNLYYHVKDPYAIFLNSDKNKRISIDNEFYQKFFKSFNGLDLYFPYHGLDIKYLQSFNKNIYYPYVQYSFTRACPWALVNAWERKSKLVVRCNWCPSNYYESIVNQKLKFKNLNLESYYVPNWQYYSIKDKFSIEDIKDKLDNEYITYNNFIVENK